MKNVINYYYNIEIKDYKKKNNSIEFYYNNKKYVFIKFVGNIDEVYKIYLEIINKKMYCHELIFNKDGLFYTSYNNDIYILLKENISIKRNINFLDVINYTNFVLVTKNINWKELWEEKIDYYEYQINELGIKYKLLNDSFSYYTGLSECAISLLNYLTDSPINIYIQHKRITYNESFFEFYNPLNFILDTKVRDIASFIKSNYINSNEDVFYYINKIKNINFDYNEAILLLARLMYPSYYFDIYDQIIQGNIEENKILKYIEKNVSFETLLKQVYKYLKINYNIPLIEWLEFK